MAEPIARLYRRRTPDEKATLKREADKREGEFNKWKAKILCLSRAKACEQKWHERLQEGVDLDRGSYGLFQLPIEIEKIEAASHTSIEAVLPWLKLIHAAHDDSPLGPAIDWLTAKKLGGKVTKAEVEDEFGFNAWLRYQVEQIISKGATQDDDKHLWASKITTIFMIGAKGSNGWRKAKDRVYGILFPNG